MASVPPQLSSQVLPEHFVEKLVDLQTRFQRLLRGIPISRTFVLANAIVYGLQILTTELESHAPSGKMPAEAQRTIAERIFTVPSPPKGARWLREHSAPPAPPQHGESKRRVSPGYVRLSATVVDPEVLSAIDAAGKLFGRRLPAAHLSRSILIREALARGLRKLDGTLDFHEQFRAIAPDRMSPLEKLMFATPDVAINPARRGRPPVSVPNPETPVTPARRVQAVSIDHPNTIRYRETESAQWASYTPPSTASPAQPPPQQAAIKVKAAARTHATPSRADAPPPQTHARARRSKRTATSPPTEDGGDGDPDPDGPIPTPPSTRPPLLELDDSLRRLLDFLIDGALTP